MNILQPGRVSSLHLALYDTCTWRPGVSLERVVSCAGGAKCCTPQHLEERGL